MKKLIKAGAKMKDLLSGATATIEWKKKLRWSSFRQTKPEQCQCRSYRHTWLNGMGETCHFSRQCCAWDTFRLTVLVLFVRLYSLGHEFRAHEFPPSFFVAAVSRWWWWCGWLFYACLYIHLKSKNIRNNGETANGSHQRLLFHDIF